MSEIIITEYVYLLQLREFVNNGKNIYKVGRTKKENHKRFNQYPPGSVLLFQMICNNCKNIENQIIKLFKENFKHIKDFGNEYFEGDYKSMIDAIYLTIKNNKCVEDDVVENDYIEDDIVENGVVENDYIEEDWKLKHIMDVKSKKYQENAFKIVCDKINNIFPDYQQDLSFGGTKKFIKISLIDDEYFVYYINPQLKSLTYTEDGNAYIGKEYYENFTEEELIYKDYNIICEDRIKFAWNEEENYFNLLVKEQIIIPNKIYDLQSKGFIKKLSTNKMKINIDNYADFINTHNILNDTEIYDKIYRILCYNLVINEKIYASIDTDVFEKVKKIKDFDNICIDIGMMLDNRNITNEKLITLHKINKKYYDYKSFLRKYTPYVIRWDINNNYYIVNRDYEYIGLNSKSIDYKCEGQAHLFNDGNTPWDNRNDYIRFCNEYKKIVNDNSLKECLNMHNSVKTILTLLD